MSIYYDLPEDQKTITKNDLTTRPTEFQIEVMRTWFFKDIKILFMSVHISAMKVDTYLFMGGPTMQEKSYLESLLI